MKSQYENKMGLRPWHRIKSKVQTRHGFGRDELFVSERIRKEHLRNYKERQDLISMRQKLAIGQMQAEVSNELHRVEGYLLPNIRVVRQELLQERQSALRKELAKLGVEKLE